MKFLIAILILLSSIKVQAQSNKYVSNNLAFGAQEVSANQIPKELDYNNKIQFALKWKDKNGENYFITTISDKEFLTPSHPDSDTTQLWEKFSYNEYLYNINHEWGTKPLLINQDDRSLACQSGVLLSIIKNSVSITDLDKDSIAEIVFASRWRCKNDITPTYTNLLFKLIEGEDTYSLQGMGLEQKTMNKKLTLENICCFDTLGSIYIDSLLSPDAQGRISNLDGFNSNIYNYNGLQSKEAPIVFLEFAKKSWITIVKKEFEEYQEFKK